ncbi:aminotransferase class IV [Paraburkholderia denitrificans]|uniref:Aminotransferase class IV n=1 Tax=Paraburkholderia denitrificans TaxID=694025 RepID=A0ABW0J705_9BURK
MIAPAWQNGRIVELADARIAATAPGVLRARAVFDGCRLFVRGWGHRKRAFTISMSHHIARLQASCDALGIHLAYTSSELVDAARVVIQLMQPHYDMGLRWFVSERENQSGSVGADVTVFARSLHGYTKPRPYRLNFAKRARWVGHGIPYSVKTMSHYAASRTETLSAQQNGFDDCLFVNQFGDVAETPRANLIFVASNELHSPRPEDGILSGITCKSLRHVIGKHSTFRWCERRVSVSDLASYTGALMLSSSLGVVPIERIGPFEYLTVASRAVADLWHTAMLNPAQLFLTDIDEFDY